MEDVWPDLGLVVLNLSRLLENLKAFIFDISNFFVFDCVRIQAHWSGFSRRLIRSLVSHLLMSFRAFVPRKFAYFVE